MSGMAQVVNTIAGIPDSIGSINGAATIATFQKPHGLAVDNKGNIYIADRDNNMIRKVSTDGIVTTIAGNGNVGDQDGIGTNATFNDPWGLVVDSSGVVYVADTKNHKIRKIDTAGNVTTYAGTGTRGYAGGNRLTATFGNPTDIEIDSDGNLFVVDHTTYLIRKITPAGQVINFAGTANLVGSADGPGASATFNRPYGLAIDSNNNIFVADEHNHLIRKIDPNGVVSTFAGTGTFGSLDTVASHSQFNYPWDLTFDKDGNLYIGDGENECIRKIATDGNVSTLAGLPGNEGNKDGIGANAEFTSPTGIQYDPNTEKLFVAEAYSHVIREITITDGSVAGANLAASDTFVSLGTNVQFTISPSNFQEYNLYINGSLVVSSNTASITTNQFLEGFNQVYAIVKTGGSSYFTNIVNVTTYAIPDVRITSNKTAFYEGELATFSVSPSQFQTYRYYDNGTLMTTSASSNHSTNTLSPGSHEVYASVSDNNDTYISDTLTVTVRAIDNPDLSTDKDSMTAGDSVLASVEPDAYDKYYWKIDGEIIDSSDDASIYITLDSIGTYNIKACVKYNDTIFETGDEIISINPNPIDLGYQVHNKVLGNTSICIGDSITISINNEYYQYYQLYSNELKIGEPFINDISFRILKVYSNTYYAIGVDHYNTLVPSRELFVPTQILNPEFSMNQYLLDENNDQVIFTIDSLVDTWTYFWDFGDGSTSTETNPTHTYQDNGTFDVSLTANNGSCIDSTLQSGAITYQKIGDIFTPTAFTPFEPDGYNDVFYIRGVKDPIKCNIYNSWGEVIYTIESVNQGWDGTYEGQIVPAGTYLFNLQILNEDGSIVKVINDKVSVIK